LISIEEFRNAMRQAHGGVLPLDDDQEKALEHNYQAPLWVIAGPGTGKTHTLVWLVLKRILVDGIQPRRIFFTTFTRKAAAELKSRLILDRQRLIDTGLREAEYIDVAHLQIGTLHSLCSRVLQDQRYEPTLRIRVLEDELTQQFFVRRSRNPLTDCDDLDFWRRFWMAKDTDIYPPNKAKRTESACKLFNRITENSADVEAMFVSDDPDFERLADAYRLYQEALGKSNRTDQAHLQRHFLSFLSTPAGQSWLGEGFAVLVDEYQDTNPVQEEIYFKLAGTRADLTVVGDDDQSLYRFRGASVESLIDFDRVCEVYLNRVPESVNLRENRRSHDGVVDWVNRFIEFHPEMKDRDVRVRAPGKRPLDAKAKINGSYPPVMAIVESSAAPAALKTSRIIQELMQEGMVKDYSQIAILTFSTRETSYGIGTYTNALRDAGIPLYNPRNRRAHVDRRLLAMLGALSFILNPESAYSTLPAQLPRGVPDYIDRARQAFEDLVDPGEYPGLVEYVEASADAIQTAKYDPSRSVNYLTRTGGRRVTLSGLMYKLLAHEPFASDLTDAEGGERLKALNLILSEYESLYDDGELRLEQTPSTEIRIHRWALYNFYAVFVEGIHDGLNDPEDDEISIQHGMVNVMTIHQSKGLQFEVVFVLRPDKQPFLSDTHVVEDELDPFVTRPTKPDKRRSRESRAAEDAIRLFFVAYSRAKRLLILVGNNLDKWERVLGQTADGRVINSRTELERAGVHLL
jgi:DNA helicase-2/ATP-dependent DNA helicase PcrA